MQQDTSVCIWAFLHSSRIQVWLLFFFFFLPKRAHFYSQISKKSAKLQVLAQFRPMWLVMQQWTETKTPKLETRDSSTAETGRCPLIIHLAASRFRGRWV